MVQPMIDENAILIVGAGPTGLTLANDLARRGVPFKIIDGKPGPSSNSKGLALNISSQYGLQLIGLDRTVGATGVSISRLNLYWEDQRYSSINFGHLKHDIRSLITQPQSVSESELVFQLAMTGQQVSWSHKLVALDERGGHIHATIANPDGMNYVQRFSYAVGCDGKYSETRKHLHTSFSGVDYNMHFVLGDFDLSLNLDANEVHYFIYPDTFFILVPIASGTWRIVVKYDGAVPDVEVNALAIERVIQRHFGADFKLGPPRWISRAPFYNRVAGKMACGRLFIAGDAAHLFSPIGGTGMNTGIQDALNLGWKLAYVHKGLSRASLLGTYETERLPAIREAAHLSDLSTQLITRKITEHAALDNLAPVMANRGNFRSSLPSSYSGVGQRLPMMDLSYLSACGNNIGKLSNTFFALLDSSSTVNLGIPSNSIWCLINLDRICEDTDRSDSVSRIVDTILELPQTRIIYHYSRTSHARIKKHLSKRESIFKTPPHFSKNTTTACSVEIVRPDGMIVFESGDITTGDISSAINSNFHFITRINRLAPEVYHEDVY